MSKFPYLSIHERIEFPSFENSSEEGVVAIGGNLSPGVLISAYSQGIFPWFNEGEEILWWTPDPRCILTPDRIYISKRTHRLMNKGIYTLKIDTAFREVIESCRSIFRPTQNGTWITRDIVEAYVELYRLGYAHSFELYLEETLVGGFYGISLGSCFFGESMFSEVSNASKICFSLAKPIFRRIGITLVDCQVSSPHIMSLGAIEIPRKQFLDMLYWCLEKKTVTGSWTHFVEEGDI